MHTTPKPNFPNSSHTERNPVQVLIYVENIDMYRGQESVGQSSDGVTNTSGDGFNYADFSASVWSTMQSDSQPRTSGASTSETSREASDSQNQVLDCAPNTVSESLAQELTASRMRQTSDATQAMPRETQTLPSDGTSRPDEGSSQTPFSDGGSRANEGTTQSPPDTSYPGDMRPGGPNAPAGSDGNVSSREPSARDRQSSITDGVSPSALTSRRLYELFEEQDRRIGNELLASPMQRRLTPQYHELAQQRIRDADNLPYARLRSEAEQGNQRALELQNRIERTNGALHQAASGSPELQELVPNLLQSIDSPRWEHLAGNQENMARLRQIAPHVADTLDTRRELGRQLQELNQSELWETNRLIDLPMRARFDYANTLVETGGGEEFKAIKYLTEMLNAKPEALNYGIRGHYGQINFGDLAVRSGALQSKSFLAALGRAGGSAEQLLREYNHRFPPELQNRNR